LPRYYDELAGALKGRVADDFGKYGVELVDFLIGAITPPEEVQKMIDERASMGAIGDMNRYMAFKTARAMEAAATNEGAAGGTAGLGLGAGLGMMMPQMMAQAMAAAQQAQPPAAPPAPVPAAAPAAPAPAPPGGTGRKELAPGMTMDEVRGMMGNPGNEVVFGPRARWSYSDITIVFENGKVSEVKF
jgi:membrane protease subunit (stomatin/prohibitin family)